MKGTIYTRFLRFEQICRAGKEYFFGSSDISSDSVLKRKTAEQIVDLNFGQQIYRTIVFYIMLGGFILTNALVKNTKVTR